jgi:glycerophosphoryl diester phosphodiesterase
MLDQTYQKVVQGAHMASPRNSPLLSPARLFKLQAPAENKESEDITWRFVAHRGANNDAPQNNLTHLPENTLPAMLEAYRVGAHTVECDIYLTRDQRIVVLHDETLRRTASYNENLAKTLTRQRFEKIRDIPITELSYADELSQVSVGAYSEKIPEAYHATPIPLLEDFLLQLKGDANRQLVIELKAADAAIVVVLQKLIARCVKEFNLKSEQLIFISFDYHLIAASKIALSQYRHLFLTISTPDADEVRPDPENSGKTLGYYHLIKDKINLDQYIKMAQEAKLDGLDVEYDPALVDSDFISKIHVAKLLCAVWTYSKDDTLATAKRMLAAKADYINTNHPQYIFEALQAPQWVVQSTVLPSLGKK